MNDEKTVKDLLAMFSYDHLPPPLSEVSKPFANLAHQLVNALQPNFWTIQMLVDLLRAKDNAVRAKLQQIV